MNRSFLVNLFSRVKSEHNPEAGWALDILSQRKSESLFLEEYENVGDCLCKINDHGCAQEDIIEELAGVERQLIEIINEQRKKIGYQRKALTYADLEIGMKFRIIDTSSQRYLQ